MKQSKLTYLGWLVRAIVNHPKKWDLKTGHSIEVAFYSGGRPYYRLTDPFNTYAARGMQAFQVYDEILMRTDVKELQETLKTMKKTINSKEIKMVELVRIINNLDERINFALPPRELLYKMGAVTYFDDSESPFEYDSQYADKKIATWKHNGDVDDFFLHNQLKTFMPLPELSKEHYQIFQQTIQMILMKQRGLHPEASQKNGEPSLST